MNILSLFDGMSCGMLALQRAGIEVTNYFASEIDKYAQIISQKNFPEIIRLGDVTKVFAKDLPKIDLIIGGSPCQGFSIAGKMLGHEDPRSKLFWEFKRLVDECNPKYFLLENVRMKKQDEQIITGAMGVKPLMINSALVSAQNRKRLYWTNINADVCDLFGTLQSHIPQPKDKHLFLKDIIEPEVDAKYYLNENAISYLGRHYSQKTIKTIPAKSKSLMANYSYGLCDQYLYCDYRTDEGLRIRQNGRAGTIQARAREDCYGVGMVINSKCYQGDRPVPLQEMAFCLSAQGANNGGGAGQLLNANSTIRRLTPIECERLQTVPDNYTAGVSETQRYKMLGNGWTVDVIAHVLSYI
jgi:DNA (cytosine-5)-methyltransferase 3A